VPIGDGSGGLLDGKVLIAIKTLYKYVEMLFWCNSNLKLWLLQNMQQ
jgi:hypothetical protein